jgi:sugar phosphate isomerase/epimerase
MKFAFSTVGCPNWDFDALIARAREYGYDGVELRGFLNESVLTAANVFLTDPQKIRRTFADGGIDICCLASSIAMTQHRRTDAKLARDLEMFIDTARAIGCPMVKIFDTQVKPGYSRASTGGIFVEWLAPLADYAAERDVVIVIENALSFRAAKELWGILDQLDHPSVGACWDVANAAMIGETPWQSVPVLNNRILYAHVKDAKLGALGATYTKLGEGDVPVRPFLTRLRGVGYTGYITLEWEKAWLPNLAEPEVIFPDSIAKLRDWTQRLEISDWEHAADLKKQPATAAKH